MLPSGAWLAVSYHTASATSGHSHDCLHGYIIDGRVVTCGSYALPYRLLRLSYGRMSTRPSSQKYQKTKKNHLRMSLALI